jgi:GDP-L-fucose synthase
VLPALLSKIDAARSADADRFVIWGTGTPRREFMYVDDLADACLFLMQHYDDEQPINVGCGSDMTIRELAQTLARVVGFEGRFEFDGSKPDGTPRKVLDVSRLKALGWQPQVDLETGVTLTYDWYCRNVARNIPLTSAA